MNLGPYIHFQFETMPSAINPISLIILYRLEIINKQIKQPRETQNVFYKFTIQLCLYVLTITLLFFSRSSERGHNDIILN